MTRSELNQMDIMDLAKLADRMDGIPERPVIRWKLRGKKQSIIDRIIRRQEIDAAR